MQVDQLFPGFLLVDKESGITSHDVVYRARKCFKNKHIGHSGTLDPMASGLLILCLGKATKLVARLQNASKTYLAEFQLGVQTDTWDQTGKVLQNTAVRDDQFSPKDIEGQLNQFEGDFTQTIPSFSAKKIRGKKLYEYARKGEQIENPSNQIQIDQIRLKQFSKNIGALEMSCSSGTYVRSIVHELGQRLGVGAVTTMIRRTKVGHFHVADAYASEALRSPESFLASPKGWLSLFDTFPHIPRLGVKNDTSLKKVLNGAPLDVEEVHSGSIDLGVENSIFLHQNGHILALGKLGNRKIHVKTLLTTQNITENRTFESQKK